jgi:hypothetical protein
MAEKPKEITDADVIAKAREMMPDGDRQIFDHVASLAYHPGYRYLCEQAKRALERIGQEMANESLRKPETGSFSAAMDRLRYKADTCNFMLTFAQTELAEMLAQYRSAATSSLKREINSGTSKDRDQEQADIADIERKGL